MTTRQIAALYVETDGAYFGVQNVDPWDEERDARRYAGPHPVVAHPPCERWGRYWHGGPSAKVRRVKGDDGGCFVAALEAVRRWGGILEHPEASAAWDTFGLRRPPRAGGWVVADDAGGWTCCVEQGHYGHIARKATWLYTCRVPKPPDLVWGPSRAGIRLDEGFHSAEERRRARAAGRAPITRVPPSKLAATPPAFREVLLQIARTVQADEIA